MDLLKVSKPLRYTGGEQGIITKDAQGRLSFCLAFPDIYEIGMSHLGFKIIYTALNSSENIVCERFFAPWPDAWDEFGSDIMRSLESHKPVKEFDVLGFSFQYEMAYTTALQLIKRSAIALKASERGESDPIVVAGGCCVLNPAPLSPFIDVFFMGEMDSELNTAMEKLHKLRQSGVSRKEQLEELNKFPFTYVPEIEPRKKVKREIYMGFSSNTTPAAPLVPVMQVVQDRVTVELARGCTNGCRFCQAGMIYRPLRERGVANLCEIASCELDATGHQELSLLSLDSGDYSRIDLLLSRLGDEFSPRNISLSLPSLRAETVNKELLGKIGAVRKGGFTIAPEAGSQRLRDIINKNLSEDEIISAAVQAKETGFNAVKLYFMCGLPYETDEDIEGIALLVRKIREATRGGGRHFDISVSVSNFVPKPHTPFERFGQNQREELFRKHNLLRDLLRKDKVKLRFHDTATSGMEAAICRGGVELAEILEKAVEEGFYLDAWSEFFNRERWFALFESCGMSFEDFSCKSFDNEDELPWDVVDCGIDKKWMKKEQERALKAETIADCRKGDCSACGVCDFKTVQNIYAPNEEYTPVYLNTAEHKYFKYELIFERNGVGSMMSALDTVRIFSHIMLASKIPLKYSGGFNPQPRMVQASPLPVGVSGDAEILYFEADLSGMDISSLILKLNSVAPEGIKVLSIEMKAWPKDLSTFNMRFSFNKEAFDFLYQAVQANIASYGKTDKRGRPKTVSLNDYLLSVDADNCTVDVLVSNKGGFHFPEYFRKSGFDKKLEIKRISVVPA